MAEYGIKAFTTVDESCRISDAGLGYCFAIKNGAGSVDVTDWQQSQVEFVISQSGVTAQLGNDPVGVIDRILLAHHTANDTSRWINDSPYSRFKGLLDHNLSSVTYTNGHISAVSAANGRPVYLIGLYNIYGG